ncbi:hypothetical protein COW36_19560 [bacterium (Candidatus Blackallbacteria) CG17_big_fil_post_rev_8_21_14_2_50_48_46]|uniref:TPM domain-containing protein n=1 Tax=bacterium (Candidatus Blackallbacteria) CG17_big_fil_post_rev_8_21_14_2_50_48_46 TaxID=2014261 RepID=A0A2M7G0S0_9BACT|nr:MAG: hypothetical protein COW64_15735 [bacterium (Candidatus Blackallbacteria) CG18_big_fil_WC_8_21_14_2_50_49_26]PIW14850.1 MAG: hypothetical protein COW36_19560 [bacterium (Candidatus Blackallbacteria) CG17_big_fil_post_rev_8_21_14_2_50_48_46]PIW44417.1 MAG: hypothetical protein COW20_24135 [bacterium (Candidatus Blackallbacteria) CG13_big_fil_rev_8_21_14_2_50_49_14]
MKKACLSIAFLLSLAGPVLALDKIPEPLGPVSDFAHVLKDGPAIEQRLRKLESETSAEIAVVTVPKLPADEKIETYALRMFNQWGIGKAETNNGLLFLLAVQEHKMRLQVGKGFSPVLTDQQSTALLDKLVKPEFKAGRFDQGVNALLDKLADVVKLFDRQGNLSASPKKIVQVMQFQANSNKLGAYFALIFGGLILFLFFFIKSRLSRISRHSRPARSGILFRQSYHGDRDFTTDTYDDDSWRRNSTDTSSNYDSGSSSYDSFGGGSSDGGGGSSDW